MTKEYFAPQTDLLCRRQQSTIALGTIYVDLQHIAPHVLLDTITWGVYVKNQISFNLRVHMGEALESSPHFSLAHLEKPAVGYCAPMIRIHATIWRS
jgi:hypothetical protein